MDMPLAPRRSAPAALDLAAVGARIAATQLPSGEIPWAPDLKTDPWDHVEAAMGLNVAGRHHDAARALRWLKDLQNPDGSWFAAYRQGRGEDLTRDANMSAYLAVGLFHHYLTTRDIELVRTLWPAVAAAMGFVLSLQADGGEIHWAISPSGEVDPMALLTGCSSMALSLKCALALAELVNRPQPAWQPALDRLEAAIATRPHLFNMTKSRFSMDWFYPVLCGAVTGSAARGRIERLWKKFVVEGQGVRCVLDEPWVTLAETSELVLALHAMGNHEQAEIVFGWIGDKRFDDGSYWCGHTVPDMVVWPEDRMSWTNAVVLMAADALYDLTPAGRMFTHRFWQERRGRG